MPLTQVASVAAPEPKLLTVRRGQRLLKAVEKGIWPPIPFLLPF